MTACAVFRRRGDRRRTPSGENIMLWTITIILFVLWLLGLVSSYTFGGWIHILLVLAVIVLVLNLLSGRRVA
jgi:fatty acid desaturase